VITATCGSLEAECRDTWAPSVDQIVLGGLEFRGYDTIDPQPLRRDLRLEDQQALTKLAGDMRWSSRCTASSVDDPNIESAIENAARCAASAFALNQ